MHKTSAEALLELLESNAQIIHTEKDVTKTIPVYRVDLRAPDGTEYRIEGFYEESAALEKEVHKRKRLNSDRPSPKIFVNGTGRNDEPPTSAGCTNQRKSTGLASNAR